MVSSIEEGNAPSIERPVERPARKGGKTLLLGSSVAQVAALLRYVALARLLGPEQLGLAATIVVTGSFFDLISETGSDRFLVQDREGDTVEVQKLVQLVYVGRGLLICLSLAVLAIPLSRFYHAPQLAWGLAILGISPLILGFMHLDIRRQQRREDFRTEAVSMIAAESCSLIVTVAAAFLTRNFTAILYGLIARAVVMTLVSHLRAERPYALGYSKAHGPRLSRFAAPLMLTGLMLFVGSQGDRVVVANLLGFRALGHYSAVLLLIYYPSAMILRYIHSISIPMMVAVRDDAARQNAVGDRLGGQTFLLAAAMCVGFAVVAPIAVPVLYGARYAQGVLIVGLVGILQTTRFLIVWPTTIALSVGRTRTVMISNLIRLVAYPCAFLSVRWLGGLEGVVAGFVAGELISIAAALVLSNRDTARPLATGFGRFADFLLIAAGVIAGGLAWERASPVLWITAGIAVVFVLIRVPRRERSTIAEGVATGRAVFRRFRARLG